MLAERLQREFLARVEDAEIEIERVVLSLSTGSSEPARSFDDAVERLRSVRDRLSLLRSGGGEGSLASLLGITEREWSEAARRLDSRGR